MGRPAEAGGDDRIGRRIRSVQALEKLGAEVLVVKADSASRDDMTAAVAEARGRFGRIDGVMHAAGVAGDGVIQLKEKAVAAAVIDAKVRAALLLTELLRDAPPDFVVHFSSLAAVVGGFGQVDYCGANSGLDALAQASRAAGGVPAISINWDAWAEVGMAVETAVRPKLAQLFKQAAAFQPIEHPVFNRVRTDGDGDSLWRGTARRALLAGLRPRPLREGDPAGHGLPRARPDGLRAPRRRGHLHPVRRVHPRPLWRRTRARAATSTSSSPRRGTATTSWSRARRPHDPENWLEHCRGHIAAGIARPAQRHDFAPLAARCTASHHEVRASSHAAPGVIEHRAIHLGRRAPAG